MERRLPPPGGKRSHWVRKHRHWLCGRSRTMRRYCGRSHVLEWHHRCAMVSRWTRGAPSGPRVDDLVATTQRTARFDIYRRQRVTGSRRRRRRGSTAARFSSSPEASHESAHRASCSVDVRMGPLRSGGRATDPDRLSRRRGLLGLPQPRSIPRDPVGQQGRVRDLPSLGPCSATAPVTVRRSLPTVEHPLEHWLPTQRWTAVQTKGQPPLGGRPLPSLRDLQAKGACVSP